MAEAKRLICPSEALPERGKGVRFECATPAGPVPAFVVRYRGRVYAYLNRCAHVRVQLDWDNGQFFDISGLYLVCSTHGAAYLPDSGLCVGGPCKGQRLVKLAVEELQDGVYLLEQEETVHD